VSVSEIARGEAAVPRILEVRTKILKKNDELAREMRAGFAANGLRVVNLVSSPGAGKTTLLTETLRQLHDAGTAVAAIVGDLETDNDARRLATSGAPVRQIMTHGLCHLEADMVQAELAAWEAEGLSTDSLEMLFIENVGNLVCPTSWDLGESVRVVLLSVTEGEDKPLKYPGLFNTADLVVITKIDLANACRFDREAALAAIEQVRPGVPVLETSATTGQGLEEWLLALQGTA
jgi:hydrogenase nickel incorporation protein HypB